jgi:hypothetical protein
VIRAVLLIWIVGCDTDRFVSIKICVICEICGLAAVLIGGSIVSRRSIFRFEHLRAERADTRSNLM